MYIHTLVSVVMIFMLFLKLEAYKLFNLSNIERNMTLSVTFGYNKKELLWNMITFYCFHVSSYTWLK